MWRYTGIWDVLNILKANILSSALIVLMIYLFYGFNNISRTLFIIDFLLCTTFVGAIRVGIRIFWKCFKTNVK